MRKNILDLDWFDCRNFFLKEDSYNTTELPTYFVFAETLSTISELLLGKYLGALDLGSAKKEEGVNYTVYGNKDGKYAWRKLELINPLIYVSLVNVITDKDNWEIIKKQLKNQKHNKKIMCLSIPVIQDERESQKASQISEWVEEIEKESIRLALDFEYLFQTDISDCYGSIYTHSLSWAIHGKEMAKSKRFDGDLCGNMVDQHLQAMSNGQTNGIPQGSVVMDFLAELLLSYTDSVLYERLVNSLASNSYEILRYRDDYRIFVKNPKDGELIIKTLSEVLMGLGLHLNTTKTIASSDVITNAIKSDKISYLQYPSQNNLHEIALYNELLLLYKFGMDYPNCGTVKKALNKLYDRCVKLEDGYFKKHSAELLSVLANIALYHPRSFPQIAIFISRIIKSVDDDDKKLLVDKLFRKLLLLPNSGLSEIWLQRITIPNCIKTEFTDVLCKKVDNENIQIFKTSWIQDQKYRMAVENGGYVDRLKLSSIDAVIQSSEVNLYSNY
jgi:hypothetical protein